MKRLVIIEDSGKEQAIEKFLSGLRHRVAFDSSRINMQAKYPDEPSPEEIILIENIGSKTVARLINGTESEVRMSIDEAVSNFDSRLFLRINPNLVINLLHLEEVSFSSPCYAKLGGDIRIDLPAELTEIFHRHLNQLSK